MYISDFLTVQTYTEVQKQTISFLGEAGAELWTSLGDGVVPGSFYSMNNKRMDESGVSASVANPARYII